MEQKENGLFQIGEVVKILGMGLTRRIILNYEDLGLITPAAKDKFSGYRYYSADNIVNIRLIRCLQQLGLSLKAVGEYLCDSRSIDEQIEQLEKAREVLDKNIQTLQIRKTKSGDMSVWRTMLPHQFCFCRKFHCKDIAESTVRLRETYIETARTGNMSKSQKMFTIRENPDPAVLDIQCCIPVENKFKGRECKEFPETPAVCIYHRGAYEKMPGAILFLQEYIEKNQIKTAGFPRLIYLEGPPNHGNKTEDYITQIAVPILLYGRGGV